MNAIVRAMATVGDAADGRVRAVRRTGYEVRAALRHRRERLIFVTAAVVTLVLYLFAIGDLAISASGRWATAPGARLAPDRLLETRAPYLFEPVAELHPGAHLAVFLSPVNLALAGLVAALVGANLAVAAHGARRAVACRRSGYGRALAGLPAFLLGFACCAPTFILALGAGTAAAVLPVLLPLRPLFYPLSVVLLTGVLVWGAHQARRQPRGRAAHPPTTDRRRASRT